MNEIMLNIEILKKVSFFFLKDRNIIAKKSLNTKHIMLPEDTKLNRNP